MAPPEFTKIATGRGNPTMLVMRGKIKVKGDIAVAAKFPTLFDIPKA
uniref:SCP2 sterol-binding domain-containing protein n=2 Tax=Janibacter TaxID=53457 RepID=A0AC61U8Q2_9MICO|nr:SCP2 sterol-binding domain-containing protein [Janibacter limosus]